MTPNDEKILITIDVDLKDITPQYLENRKKEIPDLWKALQNKDYQTLQTAGHRIKGNAGGYGFDFISLLGSQIESAAKNQENAEIENALKSLESYLDRLEVRYE